jgi:hypothetical protein
MRHGLAALVVAAALAIPMSGCGGHSPPASRTEHDAAARTFGARLIDVLERDDLIGFRELLSARLQQRSERELLAMFTTRRAALVPYAQALRDADWTVAYRDARPVVRFRAIGRSPEQLAFVVDERGALRIDEP